MKEIQLTQGQKTLVDDEDYIELSKHKWCAVKDKNTYYAVRKNKNYNLRMHRYLMKINDSSILIDHINGNGLDNRKYNLRKCTISENNNNKINIRFKRENIGVYKSGDKWKAIFSINGNRLLLGYFYDKNEAKNAYLKAVINPKETLIRILKELIEIV